MFRSATKNLAARLGELLDDMLVGDFNYVVDGLDVLADVDYHRRHPHHVTALTWTPAAGRGLGPQRHAVAGPRERRPGVVPTQPTVCLFPGSSATRPATAAARSRHVGH
jgi:hypothetical protein